MGEVYRAEDLKLEQTVALKFLPGSVRHDGAAQARLHREIRTARGIAHPNVCRVFDLGDAGDRVFLSMEYIEGEDLASLLRRIGRTPAEKGLELARQICAGLSAAHDQGVLHRDLKPANIMIDERGRAKIADFGLAHLAVAHDAESALSGTPAYMAPEQIASGQVTVKSDLYSLGLVLRELFFGRAGADQNASSRPRDVDPLIEQVIDQCLAHDPSKRPRSALEVSRRLPGGDPIQAALAAGETPSPEMVAATASEDSWSTRKLALTTTLLAGLFVASLFLSQSMLHARVPFDLTPEVLADRARQISESFGYQAAPVDREYGIDHFDGFFGYDDPVPAPQRWSRLATGQPARFQFWYRESPVALMPGRSDRVAYLDPAPNFEGMLNLRLDLRGRLLEFRAIPNAVQTAASASTTVDWAPAFAAAKLDPSRFTHAAPEFTPPVGCDQRAAWSGSLADHADIPIRLEAAAWQGQIVDFRVIAPWDEAPLIAPRAEEAATIAWAAILFLLILTVVIGAIWLTRRNLRSGRGDRSGAWKLAAAVFISVVVGYLAEANFPLNGFGIAGLVIGSLREGLLLGAVAWTFYIALEPEIRRRRPDLIVAWTRLLSGKWRDEQVGRELIVGVLLGISCGALLGLSGYLKDWTRSSYPPNRYTVDEFFGGAGVTVGLSIGWVGKAMLASLAILLFISLLRTLLRSEFLAGAVLWAAIVTILVLFSLRSWPAVLYAAGTVALHLVALARLGLLAGVVTYFLTALYSALPLTTKPERWYFYTTVILTLIVAGLVGWGVAALKPRTSLPRESSA